MKILHICPDDKFIDKGILNFENCPVSDVEHTFLVIINKESNKLKFVKSISVIPIKSIELIKRIIIGEYKEYDAVIFHSLPLDFKLISMSLKKSIKRVWIGWGYDYYSYYKGNLVLDYVKTKEINRIDTTTLSEYIKKTFKDIFRGPVKGIIDRQLKRIDIFCPVLESEFDHFKHILSDDAMFVDWNYGSQNDFPIDVHKVNLGRNILVGNSATSENNHLSILKLIDGDDRTIYLPLNYGDLTYKEWLLNKAKSYQLKYNVLNDYLSKSDYLDVLLDCNIMIFNHIRQQGASNVGLALFLGITVYLNKQSPLYKEFTNIGFMIKTTDSLAFEMPTPLDDNLLNKNKILAKETFNESSIKDKTENLIVALNNL